MEKINLYEQIICDILQSYASIKKTLTPGVKSQAIIDKESHNYQLISVGWHNGKYVYTIAFHFAIIDEKVWIHQNNTDTLIADELHEKGIPKTDIVLGFIPEKARAYSGFSK